MQWDKWPQDTGLHRKKNKRKVDKLW
jgi:hypothetical protein